LDVAGGEAVGEVEEQGRREEEGWLFLFLLFSFLLSLTPCI
jgi:hypothetical protein